MKRGKREMPAARKRGTLHSYLLSLLGMALSCALFLSVTTAWFSSEVASGGSQIYSGILDVDLWDDERETLHGKEGALFDKVYAITNVDGKTVATMQPGTTWQPNAMAVETLQVVNEGDLPFTYALFLAAVEKRAEGENWSEITNLSDEEGIQEKWDVLSVIGRYFTVWVRDNGADAPIEVDEASENETVAAVYDGISAGNGGWVRVGGTGTDGTLTDVLTRDKVEQDDKNGEDVTTIHSVPVFSGEMPGRTPEETPGAVSGETEEPKGVHSYTVALWMKPDAPSAVLVKGENDIIEGYMAPDDADGPAVFKNRAHEDVDIADGKVISLTGYTVYLNARLVASQLGAELPVSPAS